VSTQAGWIGGLEVVEVDFRPQELQFPALLAHAIEHSCDQRVFATTDAQLTQARARVGERAVRLADEVRTAKASDQLYYLGRSHLRFVPLTPVQARRVNGALGTRADPGAFLSPRQLELARRIRDALGHDPKALDGLERPSELTELDEYQTELSDRLAVTDAESP